MKGIDLAPDRFSYTRALIGADEDLEQLLRPTNVNEDGLVQIEPAEFIDAPVDNAPYVENPEDYPEWNPNSESKTSS